MDPDRLFAIVIGNVLVSNFILARFLVGQVVGGVASADLGF